MKKYLLSLFMAVFFVACSSEEVVQNDFLFKEFSVGEKVVLNNINGGSKTLVRTQKGFVVENEEDKTLMFDFFGTFCAPCKEEAPFLSALWKNNAKSLNLIGLTHFENVSDEDVKRFADDFGAFYFLSNSKENDRIVAQILADINYQNMEQLPFKVVLKDGVYQKVQDYYNAGKMSDFYLGKVPVTLMQEDLRRINKE